LIMFTNMKIAIAVVVLAVGYGMTLPAFVAVAQPPKTVEDRSEFHSEMETLLRGPIHEAFAEPIVFEPKPGLIISKEPPQPIEEMVPEQKPAGDRVTWIPGYWSWDDDRNDFIWVSGIWRMIPPNTQWVAGYWNQVAEGYQWISGYWADATASEIEYLPAPPATQEVGPNVQSPGQDYLWSPGIWMWHQQRYVWRAGFWYRANPSWCWVPAHYCWTPRGYIFVQGYWDYPWAQRGLLFAPIYFRSNVFVRPGFFYTPSIVLNNRLLVAHLFLRPHYHHYYFGDYYAGSYANRGFYPWFTVQNSRRGYDPIYSFQRWQNMREDDDWENRLQADFRLRQNDANSRPPHIWSEQAQRLPDNDGQSLNQALALAAPLVLLAKQQHNEMRLQVLERQERNDLGQLRKEIQKFSEQRSKLEQAGNHKPVENAKPVKELLPKSPIVERTVGVKPGILQSPKTSDEFKKGSSKFKQPAVPQSEPKLKQNVEPKMTREVEPRKPPQTEPKIIPQPMPKVAPKPVPKVEPKPMPKAEPKPMPRVDPKIVPKVQPKQVPKIEPKQIPRIDPKLIPRGEPKPKQRGQ
jgi:WXXGXW repeat (2 copies)